MAENWYDLGFCQMELGEIEAAIESLQTAIKLNPKYFKAWDSLGQCHRRHEQWQRAELAFRQATKINPNDAEDMYLLGWCLKKLDRTAEALECYKQSVDIDPSNARVWNSMACIHLIQNRPEEAISVLKGSEAKARNGRSMGQSRHGGSHA